MAHDPWFTLSKTLEFLRQEGSFYSGSRAVAVLPNSNPFQSFLWVSKLEQQKSLSVQLEHIFYMSSTLLWHGRFKHAQTQLNSMLERKAETLYFILPSSQSRWASAGCLYAHSLWEMHAQWVGLAHPHLFRATRARRCQDVDKPGQAYAYNPMYSWQGWLLLALGWSASCNCFCYHDPGGLLCLKVFCCIALDVQGPHLSLFLIILIVVVCAAAVLLVTFLIIRMRKPKGGE